MGRVYESYVLELPWAWNPRIVQFLNDLVCQKKPNIVFLCEMLCKEEKVEALRIKLDFEGCFLLITLAIVVD